LAKNTFDLETVVEQAQRYAILAMCCFFSIIVFYLFISNYTPQTPTSDAKITALLFGAIGLKNLAMVEL